VPLETEQATQHRVASCVNHIEGPAKPYFLRAGEYSVYHYITCHILAPMNAAFIRVGLSACDVGVSYFLPRIVGSSIASELLLAGDFIGAPRALATGLSSRVVPDTELDRAAEEMARKILRNSPFGVRLT